MEIAEILGRKLGITKLDAMIAYDSFHKKFPKGDISKQDFLDLEENQVDPSAVHNLEIIHKYM